MLYNLRGKLTVSAADFIVVECGGVGFKCFTTLNTVQNIGKSGDEVNVFTYLAVREDAMDLYGFASQAELEAFKLLISVSGIGPKAAVAILSELTPDRLAVCIAAGDTKAITAAQGVGKKTAERVVLELKDKMACIAVSGEAKIAAAGVANLSDGSSAGEAVEALVALGFSQSDAAIVVGKMDKSLTVDEMIRLGLKQLSRNL
ncbi:MAG: Holliday junction branch migration protein RuvA [Eubacterium sp.]